MRPLLIVIVPSDGSAEVVVTGTISNGRMAQRQRGRRENGGRRAGIALAGQDVEDDIGGVDTLGDPLPAGCPDRKPPVAEHRAKHSDHLPTAASYVAQPSP